MNCLEAQSYITNYINRDLELEMELAFIEHVCACPECMEELEIQYIILRGFQELEEEEEDHFSYNFQEELQNDLQQRFHEVNHQQKRESFTQFIFLTSCVLLTIIILLIRFS